ncbi:MAG: hypothetical protein MJ200_02810 [Mycoplasmoidaceae bacterium]|nr:hypothetical protein [Mycoplasmoidaceae bacterium]
MTNFDNTNSTIVDENFQLIKDAIGDILEFLDSESYEFARTVEYAFIAFISKSA